MYGPLAEAMEPLNHSDLGKLGLPAAQGDSGEDFCTAAGAVEPLLSRVHGWPFAPPPPASFFASVLSFCFRCRGRRRRWLWPFIILPVRIARLSFCRPLAAVHTWPSGARGAVLPQACQYSFAWPT